jgi:hypothetical protein
MCLALPYLLQVVGWRTLDTWIEIPVTTEQEPTAPGLPDAVTGKQQLPVSSRTTMKFTMNYKAYDTSK